VNRNRTFAGYVLLAAALVMAVVAALFYTDVIDTGGARTTLSLVLAAVAVADAAVGIVLIVKS
jgi:hypothetical protein